MKNVIFIADYFEDEIPGGGEKCNEVIINLLSKKYNISKVKSSLVDINLLENNINSFFIVSNFLHLKNNILNNLANKHKYIIYEHDHKYVKNRNPAVYKEFKIPKQDLVNIDFYKNAKLVVCQTNFHADILKLNLEFDNIISASTNFWSEKELNILKNNINNKKEDLAFILESSIEHKNMYGAIEYSKKNNLKYFTYSNVNYEQFINTISKANKFIFLPKTPETFGRVATECKILGMKLYCNNLLGVSHEDWFKKLEKQDLINHIKTTNNSFINFLSEKINE